MKPRAFTLIEVMIVTIMVAVLSVGLSLSFGGIRKSTAFGEHQTRVVEIIQKARGLSLSNRLYNNEPIDWYRLRIDTNQVGLVADGAGGTETIDIFDFDTNWNFTTDSAFEVYYFPPFGDVCFDSACTNPATSNTFRLRDDPLNPEYETEITIDVYGGFPEVVENP